MSIEMAIGLEQGKIHIEFFEPQKFVDLDPENAVAIACHITDLAFEANTGLKPVGDTLKAELIERHRMTLTTRLAHILGTLRRSEMTDGKLAQTLVERVLQEIF
jgi:hypothetical protein